MKAIREGSWWRRRPNGQLARVTSIAIGLIFYRYTEPLRPSRSRGVIRGRTNTTAMSDRRFRERFEQVRAAR